MLLDFCIFDVFYEFEKKEREISLKTVSWDRYRFHIYVLL
jgi:hypothetical protein